MVNQGIVLGRVILEKGVEIDQAKFELIVKLSNPLKCEGSWEK